MSGAVTRAPGAKALSKDDARQLTDQIRADAQSLWMQLLRAYEGNAHGALGYSSWADYCATEFDFSKSRSYQLLAAARVVETIDSQSTIVDSGESTLTFNEATAREFTPLLDDPGRLKDAHAEAANTAPRDAQGKPQVTASHVRTVVSKRRDPKPPANTGATLRPSTAPERPAPIGLNDAVAKLRQAIKRDPKTAQNELQALRESAKAGLYRPETTDAPAAVRELVEIVAVLLERP